MSIGISAVAVLFPISVLRSIQATQLTNAAILKVNTEALIAAKPEIVFDPDGNYLFGPSKEQRSELFEHVQNPNTRNYIVDPVGFYNMYGRDNNGDLSVTVADDNFARVFGNSIVSGSVVPNDGNVPAVSPYILRYDGGLLASQFSDSLNSLVESIPSSSLAAFNLTQMSSLASTISKLGDGATNQLDTTAASLLTYNDGTNPPHIIGVQLPSTVSSDDLIGIPTSATTIPYDGTNYLIADPEEHQVVLFSSDGRFSQAFPLIAIDPVTRKVFWSEYNEAGTVLADFNKNGFPDTRGLPNEFLSAVGRVILQSRRSNDYNWLLTVRRSGDGEARGVDIVIRNAAGVSIEDERVRPATFLQNGYVVGIVDTGDGTEPILKRGGFIFDVGNARWYKIRDHQQAPAIIPLSEVGFWSTYKYKVSIETPAVSSAGNDISLNGAPVNPIFFGRVICMPGIVEVYPMGAMKMPTTF